MSIHRDGLQETTKLDRIGKLAETRKDTVFNNLGHGIDLNLLKECYQRLDGKKAVGIDGITKEQYGARLEDNLKDLLKRIRIGAYKSRPSMVVEIPKEDGSKRPLAIACLEDKIVQQAVASILTRVFEPLFLPCSYGYRQGLNGHDALRALMKHSNQNKYGTVIDVDLKQYFNSIPQAELMKMLKDKITDRRFLKLVAKLIRAPIMVNGKPTLNKRGCPQGSIISPILANIYLHYVLDDWFERIKKTHIKGNATLIRYADDMVLLFRSPGEAKRFYRVLPKRLAKFGLELHAEKSSVLPSGCELAAEAHARGKRLRTYKFLGFVCYWGKSLKGFWRLMFKSRSDRFTAKLNGMRRYLKSNRHKPTQEIIREVIRVVKGWINYHAISDNRRRVMSFIRQTARILYSWRNRKGGRRRLNWIKFQRVLDQAGYPRTCKIKSMFYLTEKGMSP